MPFFAVTMEPGPNWDHSRDRREQDAWDEHAAFMDGLVEEGLIVLGGPVGDIEGDHTMLVFDAVGEETIRARMAEDPWAGELLTIVSVEPWWAWLRAESD